MRSENKPHIVKRLVILLIIIAMLIFSMAICVFGYIHISCGEKIIDLHRLSNLSDVDLILVLGCGIKEDGTPSDMLHDRVEQSVNAYNRLHNVPLLFSGDSQYQWHDEVGSMKSLALELGADENDILLDGYGLSTYDSIWRAKEIFGAKKIVIVTQSYHLYRALYIAKQLGIDAYGISSNLRRYKSQFLNNCRELIACNKDYFYTKFGYQHPMKEVYVK